MRFRSSTLWLGLALVLTPGASAQSFPFQLVVQDNSSNITTIANSSTLTLVANAPQQKVALTVIAIYQGSSTVTITGQPSLFGSNQFSAPPLAGLPTLTPGGSVSFTLSFTPTSSTSATAQVTIPYTEAPPANSGPSAVGNSGVIRLFLAGTAPQFVVTYFLQADQNILPLADGDTLTFPPTPVLGSTAAGLVIQNQGSGPGTISAIKVTGSAFQVQGVPLLPGTVNSSSSLQVTVRYSPTKAQNDQGTLQVVFPDRTVTVNLTGTGTNPSFTYQLVEGGQTTNINPSQVIAIPPVAIGSKTSFSITVQNSGNGTGTVSAIGLSGTGFQLTDAPTFPQVLAAGAFFTLGLSFTPNQAGPYQAHLRIGNDTFDFTSQGQGTQLQYAYATSGGITTPIVGGQPLIFTPVPIGLSSSVVFSIQNSGTIPANVLSISLVEPKSAYTLTGLPSLPLTLAPNETASFSLVFTPTSTGTNAATLRVDTQTFPLAGPGTAPPSLPAYQFVGASGVQAALQQPGIGLTLAAPYPLPLTGNLLMIVNPDRFNSDPAVQFATGGRTVTFSIPANTTQAIFPNNSTTIKLQTGSVSGSISISPTFTTSAGYDLTPANPTPLLFSVLPVAPQLLSAQVVSSNPTGLTLQVIGLTTTQTITALNFIFTPRPNFTFAANTLTVNIASQAAAWFESSQAQAFGGQFTIQIPFTLTSSTTTSTVAPISALQSVSVSAVNEKGTSAVLIAPIN